MDTLLTAQTISNNVDHEWIDAARSGERWALEHCYQTYRVVVYGLCYRILGRTDDAEDATQATFVKAFSSISRFRGDSAVKTWIIRIATNEAVAILRVRGRNDEMAVVGDALGANREDLTDRIAINCMLAKLPHRQRIILILHYWENLSCDEIAQVLNISRSGVKMRLVRARLTFRKLYGETR